MVVVAIMGTLAAIAIPAYNEYRKSAKKTAYKSDVLSLHKGVLAFGVELDSFCERETKPKDFSIKDVGMVSLTTSKLYGNISAITAQTGVCDIATSKCTNSRRSGVSCTGNTDCDAPAIPAGHGPGKINFIGFGDVGGCTNIVGSLENTFIADKTTSKDSDCKLGISDYRIGVFGHISGTDFIAFNVDHQGVVKETDEKSGTKLVDTDINETCT